MLGILSFLALLMHSIHYCQLSIEPPVKPSLRFLNGPKLVVGEVLVDLHALLDVNVLEESCVDMPLAVGNDLGADEALMLGSLCLNIRLVLEQ